MATPSASSQVSSRESEPVKECRLVLTTLLGSAVEMTTSVVKRDRLEDLEDHVVDYLVSVTDLDVFGCTLDFVHPTMQTHLEDAILGGVANKHAVHHCAQPTSDGFLGSRQRRRHAAPSAASCAARLQ